MVLTCNCKFSRRNEGRSGADFQDARYGSGRRVHNRFKMSDGTKMGRCTVCGNERQISQAKLKAATKTDPGLSLNAFLPRKKQ